MARNRSKKHRISQHEYEQRRIQNELAYAQALSDPKGTFRNGTVQLANKTASSMAQLLQSPYSNYEQIANYMSSLTTKSGAVDRILDYFATIPTYNHLIYCSGNQKTKYDIKNVTTEDYLTVASVLSDYQLRFYAPYFMKRMLEVGTVFLYEIFDNDGVAYIEFPVSYGRINRLNKGVYGWEIDISKLKEELRPYLPKEMQKAMDEKNAGNTDSDKWRENKWYTLSDSAFALTIDGSVNRNGGIAISKFAQLLMDSIRNENAKDRIEIKDNLDTVRIIHAKIPLTKEGKPTISAQAASNYKVAMERNMPEGVIAVVNPMDLENVPLNGSGASKMFDVADHTRHQLYDSAGVPANLFGDTTTSYNIVLLSIKKDIAFVNNTIIPMLENYYNRVLFNVKTKSNATWKFKFIRQSIYTFKDDVQVFKDAVSMGGSRVDYLASIGNDPLEIYNKLVMEQQVLDIDIIMQPKPTSYTMSSSEQTGRPQTDEPTDDTDRLEDAN